MLTIELSINERPIGTIGVWNTQDERVPEDGPGRTEIRYQVHDLRGCKYRGGEIDDYPLIAEIWHDSSDGAAALSARVMAEVPEDRLPNDQ